MAKKQTGNETTEFDVFSPDLHKLHEEWVRQPQMARAYGNAYAIACRQTMKKKAHLDFIFAEMDAKIRKDPAAFGMEKTTEPAIKAAILSSEDYIAAQKEHIEATYAELDARAAVTAMEHRKKALEDLVILHGRSYFATPVDRSRARQAEETQLEERKVNTRLNRGKNA